VQMSYKELRFWLNYFDQSLSRRQGRKLPKSLTVPNPKPEEILKVCRELGYECEAEEKRHPSTWYRPSTLIVVKVPSSLRKYELMKIFGRKLLEMRGRTPEGQ
jgi:signal recognition particle subunit SRP19